MKQKRTRETLMTFYVSADEEEKINKKMAAASVTNMSAYLRKMAIDGIIVRLDDPEIKELIAASGKPVLAYADRDNEQMAKDYGAFYDEVYDK